MAAATVLDRCQIQPTFTTTTTTAGLSLPLIHFDLSWIYFPPIQRLLFFDLPNCSTTDFLHLILPSLKLSLSHSLSLFPPLAGNILHPLPDSADTPTLTRPFSRFLPGDSVSLTVALCNKDFKHLTGNHPRVSDELYACVPRLPPQSQSHSPRAVLSPVLAIQLTFFPDHGLCIGFP